VPGVQRRLAEASRLGLRSALVPPGGRAGAPAGMRVLEVATLDEALDAVRRGLHRGAASTARAEQAGPARPEPRRRDRPALTEAPPRPRLVLAEPLG
jgi:DNA repair protein RadA/Sms